MQRPGPLLPVEKFEGWKRRTYFFVVRNQMYSHNVNGYIRCYRYQDGCGARGRFLAGNSLAELSNEDHFHAPPVSEIEELVFLRDLDEEALSSHEDNDALLERLTVRTPTLVNRFQPGYLQNRITQCRNINPVQNVNSLEDLARLLRTPDSIFFTNSMINGNSIFQRFIDVQDDGKALIFFDRDTTTEIVTGSDFLTFDGTFDCRPNHPDSRQVLLCTAIRFSKAYCVAVILMSRKTKILYQQVLLHLKDICGDVIAPIYVITDFEAALRAAVRLVFPDAILVGCHFHFSQCIWRRTESIEGARDRRSSVRTIILMVIALAFLPAFGEFGIEVGFAAVKAKAVQLRVADRFTGFFEYFQNYWINTVGVAYFSVYGMPRRTNNNAEAVNRWLNFRIGHRPAPVDFIRKLRYYFIQVSVNFENGTSQIPSLNVQDRNIETVLSSVIRRQTSVSDGLLILGGRMVNLLGRPQQTVGNEDAAEGDWQIAFPPVQAPPVVQPDAVPAPVGAPVQAPAPVPAAVLAAPILPLPPQIPQVAAPLAPQIPQVAAPVPAPVVVAPVALPVVAAPTFNIPDDIAPAEVRRGQGPIRARRGRGRGRNVPNAAPRRGRGRPRTANPPAAPLPVVAPLPAVPVLDPVVAGPVPDPVIAGPVPDPVIAGPVPDPVVAGPVPDPVIAGPVPDPVVAGPVPDPVIAGPVPDPVIAGPVPDPVVAGPVPDPVIAGPVPDPVVAGPVAIPPLPNPPIVNARVQLPDRTCRICLVNNVEFSLRDCGHMLCRDCRASILNYRARCHICRRPMTSFVKVVIEVPFYERCRICLNNTAKHVFQQCGHLVCSNIRCKGRNPCPICGTRVTLPLLPVFF